MNVAQPRTSRVPRTIPAVFELASMFTLSLKSAANMPDLSFLLQGITFTVYSDGPVPTVISL